MRSRKTNNPRSNHSGKYIPIDCSTYARYEIAVLKGQAMRIAWTGRQQQAHVETVYPVNLRTRWHSEFLIGHNQLGQQRVLRLDRIRTATILLPASNSNAAFD